MKFLGKDKYGCQKTLKPSNHSLAEGLKSVYKELVGPLVSEINSQQLVLQKGLKMYPRPSMLKRPWLLKP